MACDTMRQCPPAVQAAQGGGEVTGRLDPGIDGDIAIDPWKRGGIYLNPVFFNGILPSRKLTAKAPENRGPLEVWRFRTWKTHPF